MMSRYFRSTVVLSAVIVTVTAFHAPAAFASEKSNRYSDYIRIEPDSLLFFAKKTRWFIDRENRFTSENISDPYFDLNFTETGRIPALPGAGPALWGAFSIENRSGGRAVIFIANSPVLELDFFILEVNTDSTGSRALTIRHERTGQGIINRLKPLKTDSDGVIIEPGQYRVYLRASSNDSLHLPLIAADFNTYSAYQSTEDFIAGIVTGSAFLVILYFAVLAVLFRDPEFVIYILFISVSFFAAALLSGHGSRYIWGKSLLIAENRIFMLSIASVISILFFNHFLKPRVKSKPVYYLYSALIGGWAVNAIIALAGYHNTASLLQSILGLLVILTFTPSLAYLYFKKNYRPAGPLFFAYSVYSVGIFWQIMQAMNIFEWTIWGNQLFQAGNFALILLMPWATSYRITDLFRAKEAAEADRLKLLEENRYLIKEQNEILEEMLAEKTEELEEADRMKDRMLAMASHDIKGPAGNIISLSDLIRELNDDTELHKFIDRIDSSARQITDIVHEIIENSALKTGTIKLNKQEINLKTFITEELNHHEQNLKEKKQRIILSDCENENCAINTDPDRFRQVIHNLISNASKYSPPGSEISVQLSGGTEEVQIEIIDKGPGFSETDLQKVFNPFEKLSARPTGGEKQTGLGLFIVKELVKALEGNVFVRNHPDGGSVFTVVLNK